VGLSSGSHKNSSFLVKVVAVVVVVVAAAVVTVVDVAFHRVNQVQIKKSLSSV